MAAKLKYKSVAVYWDGLKRRVITKDEVEKYRLGNKVRLPLHILYFSSRHEFTVYLELLKVFPSERIIVQYPVEVLPPSACYPRGKTWKIDFAVLSKGEEQKVIALIEAKGCVTVDFAFSIACFEQRNKSWFNKLWLVFDKSSKASHRLIKNLCKTDMRHRIVTTDRVSKVFQDRYGH